MPKFKDAGPRAAEHFGIFLQVVHHSGGHTILSADKDVAKYAGDGAFQDALTVVLTHQCGAGKRIPEGKVECNF